jgi:benzylsuccinate CoA-transferase BbsF subunit
MSDIMGESFRGGVMQSLELDYESIRRFKPDIIYISSQGYGGGGPYSNYQAYGPINAAASGLTYIWSHPDDPYPAGTIIPHPDHIAGKHAVLAVLAALDYRRRTGKGQFIDLAQTEVAAALIGEIYLDYTINNRIAKPMGNRSPYAAPHGCYRCKGEDQWCAISVFTNDEWRRFCDAIGNPGWTVRPEFADTPSRLKNVDELDRLVEEWTIQREPYEVEDSLQQAGVAAGIARRAPDILNDPQLKHRDAFVELDHPVVGKRVYPSPPFKLSGISPFRSVPAPIFGQHTEEICHEILGMTGEEIDRLKEEGILEGP